MTASWKREEKKMCQYIIVTDSTCQETDTNFYNTSGNEEILNIIFDMKSPSYFNIHSKVQMSDNINTPPPPHTHTHTAYTTNKCKMF